MSKNNQLFRFLLKLYRGIVYAFFGRQQKQVMPVGVVCNIITSNSSFDKYKSDIVHPCVRYTEKAFRGYHWWLIYTPYFNSNASLENPILCNSKADNEEAPTSWQIETLIRDTPIKGYNSDPTMFFNENGLNIFWRENETERNFNNNVSRAIYGLILSENSQFDFEKPILAATDKYFDKEVSPTIIKRNGKYTAYTADVRLKNPKIHFRNAFLNKFFSFMAKQLSVLDLYNEQKSYGIAIYESVGNNLEFQYKKTVRIQNCNKLHRPWHFDFFEYENKLYAIIQTNQFNADICLAASDDYETFMMFKKPLITQTSIKKLSLYKATGIVHNGIFHLYYTAQDKENRSLNKLYYSKYNFEQLLYEIK